MNSTNWPSADEPRPSTGCPDRRRAAADCRGSCAKCLPEFLARTLSLRERWLDTGNGVYQADEIAALEMMIARYDRNLAARLLRPQIEQLGALRSLTTQDFISFRVLAALATIDPRQAVERIEKLPDDPRGSRIRLTQERRPNSCCQATRGTPQGAAKRHL